MFKFVLLCDLVIVALEGNFNGVILVKLDIFDKFVDELDDLILPFNEESEVDDDELPLKSLPPLLFFCWKYS